MGKNSNVHLNRSYIEDDIRREREEEAKRQARRLQKEQKLRERSGDMLIEEPGQAAAAAAAAAATAAAAAMGVDEIIGAKKAKNKPGPTKKFGKVSVGSSSAKKLSQAKKLRLQQKAKAPTVQKHLELKKSGIRKPSNIMKKTLKKMAKKRFDMDWS